LTLITPHRGGQLSIHGNVVNVPADVNSVVNTLPKFINESQSIPIKLKSKLGKLEVPLSVSQKCQTKKSVGNSKTSCKNKRAVSVNC